MANIKSAKKDILVSEKRHTINKSVKSLCRTRVKTAEAVIASGDLEEAKKAVVTASSTLDSAAQKGVIHPNNAARRKSRLVKKLNGAAPAEAPKA